MHNTLLLSKVLLRQNLATMLGFGNTGRRKRSQRSSLVSTAVLAVVLLALTGALGFGAHEIVGHLGLGRLLLTLLLGAMGLMMFLLAIPSVLGSFYAASDIEDLLPLPLPAHSIVTAKSVVAIASSYVLPTMGLLGPLAGWGIAAGEGPFFWLVTVAIVLFAPMLPFAYAGIVSMALARFSRVARRKDVVTTIATVVSIAIMLLAIVAQQFLNSSTSAASIVAVGNAVGALSAVFPSFGFAVEAAAGSSLPALGAFIAISVAGMAVFIAFAQLVYLRTVTSLSSGGGKTRAFSGEVGKATASAGRAILRADLRRLFRTPALWLNQVAVPLVIVCVAIFPIYRAGPPLTAAMGSMDAQGVALAASLICSIIVLFAGLIAAANRLSGTVISREGSNWDFVKTIPVSYKRVLKTKMLPGVVVNMILVVVPCCAVVLPITLAGLSPMVFVCTLVLGCSLAWLSGCLAVSSDAANPRVSWGNDGEVDNKTVGGGAGMFRGLIATVIYSAMPLAALLGLPWEVVLPVAAVIGLVAAVVLGRVFIRKAAVNLRELER